MIAILLSITLIHFMGLVIPGPDFFFVSQSAVRFSRKESFKGVLGITLGVMFWSGLVLLGLHLMLERTLWLRHLVVILGAGYLSYLAYQLMRSALIRPVSVLKEVDFLPPTGESLFLRGLLTNLSNPKAIAYFASVFSMFVVGISQEIKIIIYVMVTLETLLWFTLVMGVFSLPLIKESYQKIAPLIDGLAGLIFFSFALYFLYLEFISFI